MSFRLGKKASLGKNKNENEKENCLLCFLLIIIIIFMGGRIFVGSVWVWVLLWV